MAYVAEVVVLQSQLLGLGGMECAVVLDGPLDVHSGAKEGPFYLSVQPDGTLESRSEVGAWETATRVADLAVYPHTGVLNRAFRVVPL